MHILGLSCFYHDAAAALLKDGSLVAAAQEERFSRIKNDSGYPRKAIEFCLRQAGIAPMDLDYVVFYEKPMEKFGRILLSSIGTFPRSWRTFGEAMTVWLGQKLWIKSLLLRELGIPESKVLFTDHHASHAASALFCSPFDEAAILTVDGVGEWTTASWGTGRSSKLDGGLNQLALTHEQRFPHSLGLLYSAFTAFLGFEVNEGEYKVMGMAPYGVPVFAEEILKKVVTLHDDGSLHLDMRYFGFHRSPDTSFSERFVDLFGEPREPGMPFSTPLTDPGKIDPESTESKRCQHYANVAASIQKVTEEALLRMARHVHRQTGSSNLCMAGGVALNSVANGRIFRETPFKRIFIQPAAGDAGGALGAALYVHNVLLHHPKQFTMEHAYWGEAHDEGSMKGALDGIGAPYQAFCDEKALVDLAVDNLEKGKVLGLFQGRFEWGPRALGNRSILADPRREQMKGIVNAKIKFREPFRPFAPVVLEERAKSYFEGLGEADSSYPARFMQMVLPWNHERGENVPAVNHLGTGRLQTVRSEWNPLYRQLVQRFGDATGVPILMNTSFNLRGEPIVGSPEDAVKTFLKSGLDAMIMGPFWVEKGT